MSSDNQTERVTKVFQKLQNIQASIQTSKHENIQQIQNQLYKLQRTMDIMKEVKEENLSNINDTLLQIKKHIVDHCRKSNLAEKKLEIEFDNIRINFQKQIQKLSQEHKFMNDSHTQQISKFHEQILSTIVIDKEKNSEQYQKWFDKITQEQIPQFRKQIENEIQERKQLESNLYQQYMSYIVELNQSLTQEQEEREQSDEKIILLIQKIQQNSQEEQELSRRERQLKEQSVLKLVEGIVQKIRSQLIAQQDDDEN